MWLGKASFCDPNVFSSSYLPAIVICRLLFTKKKCRQIFSFSVCSKYYYSISVRLTVILTVEKQTSEYHLSKENNAMHIIQMVQEQHAINFGYAFFRRFRLFFFYRNRKGLKQKEPLRSIEYIYSKLTYFPEGQQFTKKKIFICLMKYSNLLRFGFLLNVSQNLHN